MNRSKNRTFPFIRGNLLPSRSSSQSSILTGCVTGHRPKLSAIPEVPALRPIDSVPLGDLKDLPEVK